MSPHHIAGVFGEDEPQQDQYEDPGGRDQSAGVVSRVHQDEDGEGQQEGETEEHHQDRAV